MSLTVRSRAFTAGEAIPARYTCDDVEVSPPLEWSPGPHGTESYALIMDDPDAPGGTWVHWVVWNITDTKLPEDVTNLPPEDPEGHVRQGTNSWQRVGYGGPCPPSGTHRYLFKVYALDRQVDLDSETTKAALLAAMEGRTLDRGELMGTYSRR